MASYTPNRSLNRDNLNQTLNSSTVLERSISLNRKRRKLQHSLIWFGINCLLLTVIIYDLAQTCPMYMSTYHYIEYSIVIVLTLNIFYYFGRIIKHYLSRSEQIAVTAEQRKLLGISESDPNYMEISPVKPKTSSYVNVVTPQSVNKTPLNMTALSWGSNPSPSPPTLSWGSNPSSRQVTPSNVTALSWMSQNDASWSKTVDKDSERAEKAEMKDINKFASRNNQNVTSLLSSFWSHPMTKSAKDTSSLLKQSQYQLSSQSPTSQTSPSKSQDITKPNSEVWMRINVDSVALTQWNENLRIWISQTILERLIKEFDFINDTLDKHGMSDIKIGTIGLDRLRKVASMSQVSHFIPTLSAMISFLEAHPNQDYLVKRIRTLAKGGCMSEFKWNGGGQYNNKEWDESLPTDSAIIMHLLASYLDTQLLPSPNLPDAKAFTGQYYLKTTDKSPPLTANSLFIQEVSEKPPHYRVIVGEKTYEMVKGYNNLFHSIIFFIYHVNKREQGMLGRVNLGRAGVNMLWIIGLNE